VREARRIIRPEARRVVGSGVLRTFFAVELPDAARRAAAELARRLAAEPGGEAVRWVRPESYHVTLRFLGDTPAARLGDLVASVRRASADHAPLALRLGALSDLPNARRPRVVAVEVEPPELLAALAAAVERGVVAAGFAPEARPFRAHLTLGRVRSRAPRLDGRCEAAPFAVDSFALFRSDPGPGGAHYTPLERIALEGRTSP